ncbi:hypothetical protein GCM10028827_29910 [Mucilaginibacter myungsuensis]
MVLFLDSIMVTYAMNEESSINYEIAHIDSIYFIIIGSFGYSTGKAKEL